MAPTSSTAAIMTQGPFPTLLGCTRQDSNDEALQKTPYRKDTQTFGMVVAVNSDRPSLTSTSSTVALSPVLSDGVSSASSPTTSPTASSAYSAARQISSNASPLSSGLVVRNTFLDFANTPRQELRRLRRARSVELPRRTWEDQEVTDVSESSSIANVGVGRASAEVPYLLGQPLAKHSTVGLSFDKETEEQRTPELPSIGSAGHHFGNCVPCGFFWKSRGCVNGERCEYCHLCDSREKKRRQKAKKTFFKSNSMRSDSSNSSNN